MTGLVVKKGKCLVFGLEQHVLGHCLADESNFYNEGFCVLCFLRYFLVAS